MRTKRGSASRRRRDAAVKPAAKTNKLANFYAMEGAVRGSIDLPFLVIVLVLLLMGLVALFTASHASAYYQYGDSYYYIKRQSMFAAVGIAAMLAAAYPHYNLYRKYALHFYVLTVVMLVMVLVPGIGIESYGATRWLGIGPLQFQPSELAKLAIVVAFAKYIDINYERMNKFSVGILPFVAFLGIMAALVVLEKHFSGTILIVLIGIVLMAVGGSPMRWIVGAGTVGAAGMLGMMLFTELGEHAKTRIDAWLDPFSYVQTDAWQAIQSLYAIGSGGLTGLGLGNSRQKYLYLPKPENDFIFSVVCEELGFIGAVVIIIFFILLVWRGFVIAFKAPDRFSSLVVIGIITHVAIQVIFNIAVVTNLFPTTGISLPFFSSGGTSLVILLAEMGIVLAISRYAKVEKT